MNNNSLGTDMNSSIKYEKKSKEIKKQNKIQRSCYKIN